MRSFTCEIEGKTPLLMHKFPLIDVENLPLETRVREAAYIRQDGELYAPAQWVRSSLINAFLSNADVRSRKTLKNEIAPYIQVEPAEILLGTKEYETDVQIVSIKQGCKQPRYRPKINSWKLKFTITTTLPNTYTTQRFKEMLELAGYNVGIGDNRPNGFGRSTVTSFTAK